MSTGQAQRPDAGRSVADRLVLVVMAKAPVPGLAKSRLAPTLGPAGAAGLAQQLLEHTLAQACSARPPAAVTLACAPDASHPVFSAQQARHAGLRLVAQAQGDVGQRLQQVLMQAFMQADRVLLMGTSAPAVNAAVLRQAGRALLQADAVFVPTHDGAYALLGLRRPAPFLFDKMPWRTPQVLALSQQRLQAVGRRCTVLAPVYSIDTAADLVHLPSGWAAGLPAPERPEPVQPPPTPRP